MFAASRTRGFFKQELTQSMISKEVNGIQDEHLENFNQISILTYWYIYFILSYFALCFHP